MMLLASEGVIHAEAGFFLQLVTVMLLILLSRGVKKKGMPEVIGWVISGITISALAHLGWSAAVEIQHGEFWKAFSFIGAAMMFFKIGLESNIEDFKKSGIRSLNIATIGVILPITSTVAVGGLSFVLGSASFATLFFMGATLAATSVGITMDAFGTLDVAKEIKDEILGAGIFDDIQALIVLPVALVLLKGETVTSGTVIEPLIKSLVFLAGGFMIGAVLAPVLGKAFSRLGKGSAMKVPFAMLFCFGGAYLAFFLNVEYVIGSFVAGVALRAVHFKLLTHTVDEVMHEVDHTDHLDVDHLVEPLTRFFVPIYFIVALSQLDFEILIHFGEILVPTLILTVVACVAKIIAGFAGSGNWKVRLLKGIAMMIRGEVGLFLATTGKVAGAFNDEQFGIALSTVLLTTIIGLIALPFMVKFADATAD